MALRLSGLRRCTFVALASQRRRALLTKKLAMGTDINKCDQILRIIQTINQQKITAYMQFSGSSPFGPA